MVKKNRGVNILGLGIVLCSLVVPQKTTEVFMGCLEIFQDIMVESLAIPFTEAVTSNIINTVN